MAENRCPLCNREYSGAMNFCLEDGTPLEGRDSEETVISARRGASEPTSRPNITITRDRLTINGQLLSLPVTLDEIESILGEADRRGAYYGAIPSFWDDLGIICLESANTFEIPVIWFVMNRDPNQVHRVRRAFKGQMTIDGVAVTNKSTIESINTSKKGDSFTRIEPGPWSVGYGATAINLVTSEQGVVVTVIYVSRASEVKRN